MEEWPALRLRYGFQVEEERPEENVNGRDLVPGLSADLTRRTLFGRAITVGVAAQYESLERLGRLFLNTPTFFGQRVQSSLTLERSRQERSQLLDQMVDHDGIIQGYKAKAVLHPVQQRGVWTVLLGSKMDPEAGNFSAINVIKEYDNNIKRVQLRYWTNTTTNWAVQTDADNGFQMRWRKKFASKTWIDHNAELMNYSLSGRWDNGTSEPRCVLFVNA